MCKEKSIRIRNIRMAIVNMRNVEQSAFIPLEKVLYRLYGGMDGAIPVKKERGIKLHVAQ